MSEQVFQVRDLVAGYEPGVPIVRGASIRVDRGEIVVVLGALAESTDDPAKVMAEFEGVTGGKAVVATATLRRDTLLPLECTRQTDSWMELPGEPRREEREVHRYTFEWR